MKPTDNKKIFLHDTKMGYGRSDFFYLLDDLNRISGYTRWAKEYTDLLKNSSCTNTKVISWDFCLRNIAKKLKQEKFDVTISIGRVGNLIAEDLKNKNICLGKTFTFFVTRLSDPKWKKIAYINTPGKPSLLTQAKKIKELTKKAKRIAIIDDVTYSGGTRKVLEHIIGKKKLTTAIDLLTIKNTMGVNTYYTNWISGKYIHGDPYPTLNSNRQADIMNVSEFIYPSKNIGYIISGKVDCNKVLWSGKLKILKKCAYTANKERNLVYFGDQGNHIKKETKKFCNLLPQLF